MVSVKARLISESAQGSDLAPFFGDRSQSEKPPEIKLPLNMLETEKNYTISNFRIPDSRKLRENCGFIKRIKHF